MKLRECEEVRTLLLALSMDMAPKLKLSYFAQVLSNDFFLVATRDDFIENARLFIFETYCRIHQRIDIA